MIEYNDLFTKFRDEIASEVDEKTPEITKKIKTFFASEFSNYFVAPSSKEKEFLVDIFVSTRNPRKLGEDSNAGDFKVILVAESELGGEGGGAQGYLKRNVFEDFAKLLVIQSEYKVLIFTSLPYYKENDHLEKRICEINSIYKNAGCPGDILLIHLHATSQKTPNGHPTNPKVSLKRDTMSAYVLSNSLSVQRLA
ncbi:hypothetical protein LRS11_16200 [Pseudomonas sp. J452]|uniref:hypothetical protein n=1 Tax=Pseudomonas sp. J452 TaxID=2898441 RepID=UPI0021AD5F9B|nr:hypothetical protein [Pseudomonas sp. J452]UUY07355.1 hypothetical protein LRS11_16200 [Pseudomonas sp. J452]